MLEINNSISIKLKVKVRLADYGLKHDPTFTDACRSFETSSYSRIIIKV